MRTALLVLGDLLRLVALSFRSHHRLAAENLFLRKQLAFYLERQAKPRRVDNATRITLVVLARFIDWRRLLTVVQPDTLVRWHRQGFRLFWRWKSRRRGRPAIPVQLQQLIAEMAKANRTWGEERIAAELLLKLGVSISARTVRRYMRRPGPSRHGSRTQAWNTFVHNHASELLACDFFLTVTATFVHWNLTEHPTAEWTVQQFRTCLTGDEPYRFVIHDRDSIYSPAVDRAVMSMHLRVLKTPVHVPQANAYYERLIGTARRECLDFVIPLNERHLRRILAEWVLHYNVGRPHSSLGPGIPDRAGAHVAPASRGRGVPPDHRVVPRAILGGLHHEYRLESVAA